MRRLTVWIVSTVALVVLLFSYRTSLGGSPPGTAAAAAPGIVPDDTAPPSPGPTAGATTPPKARTLTVNGTVAGTRWGPVQVQVKIQNQKIVDVRVLRRPTGNDHDDEINGYALPRLRAKVLRAQNAHVDAVSGATVTSGGYLESLQAALDAAHFG
ncbi:FMN-binding protein [Actinoplanes sp. NPDC049265]|uniref:FMN-binding protein n=1 Tax=Actinoplanes sp. NPDC049265 TaxID=3363902 RepID=UPI0037232CCD